MDVNNETKLEYKTLSFTIIGALFILIIIFVQVTNSAQEVDLKLVSQIGSNGILTFTVANAENEDFLITTLKIDGNECYTCLGNTIIPARDTSEFSCKINKEHTYSHSIVIGSQNLNGKLNQESLLSLVGTQPIVPIDDVNLIPRTQKRLTSLEDITIIDAKVDDCENIILTANRQSNSQSKISLIYIDYEGNTLKEHVIESKTFESGVKTLRDADGSFITIGTTYIASQGNDGVLVKNNNLFHESWKKRIGSDSQEIITDLEIDSEQNNYVALQSTGTTLLKFDPTLLEVWQKEFADLTILDIVTGESVILLGRDTQTKLIELSTGGEKGSEQTFSQNFVTLTRENNTIYLGGNEGNRASLYKLGSWSAYTGAEANGGTQRFTDVIIGPNYLYALTEVKNGENTQITNAITKISKEGDIIDTYTFPRTSQIRIKTIELTSKGLIAAGESILPGNERSPYVAVFK